MAPSTTPEANFVHVKCPLCGADDAVVIHRTNTLYFDTPVSMTVTKCRSCGMTYTNPRLAEVNRAYEHRDDVDPDYVRMHTEVKAPVFRVALDRIERLRPSPATILDVGCGVGAFLKAARDRGYEVSGIEPSAADAKYAREELGLQVEEGIFEDAHLEPGSVDIVTLWDVIEHVADPRSLVKRAASVLKPGGVIAMRMPGAAFHRVKSVLLGVLMGSKASVYSPVVHLSFFSAKTMTRLLTEEGFADVQVRLTTAEAHAPTAAGRAARSAWRTVAGVLSFTGLHLDNLEVYASRS